MKNAQYNIGFRHRIANQNRTQITRNIRNTYSKPSKAQKSNFLMLGKLRVVEKSLAQGGLQVIQANRSGHLKGK